MAERGPRVRALTGGDLDWVVEVSRDRRESLVPHAPRFWRPAADATARHRGFLGHLVGEESVLSVRTDHGYLIALPQGRVSLVDDMVVTRAVAWPTEGVALLRHAQETLGPLRVVVPAFEAARLEAVLAVGLSAVECWWHRDLDPAGEPDPDEEPDVVVDGAVGRLVPAPPVYDPGGPVLLVSAVGSAAGLRAAEDEASRRGATVSVVSADPRDDGPAALLRTSGYRLTTRFCE